MTMVRKSVRTLVFGIVLWASAAGVATPSALAQGCLSQGDMRAAVQNGEAVALSRIKSQIEAASGGEVQGIPRLCDVGGQLVYMVNVLTSGGQIERLTVDARSGAILGSGY
jgi:uncharacterized membrane protein YkoI